MINAATAAAARLPAQSGPDGMAVPRGTCPEWIGGRVWMLPCANVGPGTVAPTSSRFLLVLVVVSLAALAGWAAEGAYRLRPADGN